MSDKWIDLIRGLIQITKEGSLEWEYLNGGYLIRATIGDNQVEIEREMNRFLIVVKDWLSEEIDRFSDDDLTSLGYSAAYSEIDSIFTSVRRKATGADEVIDTLLLQIDQKKEIPF